MPPTLNKYVKFGFGLQTQKGTQNTATIIWTPFSGSMGFKKQVNKHTFRQADNREFLHQVVSGGHWWEGSAPISLIPVAGTLTALISWIQDRDANNQGKWASVYIAMSDVGIVRAAKDVKVRTASLKIEKGADVTLSLELAGLSDGATVTPGTVDTGYPLRWNEAAIKAQLGSAGSLTADTDMESFEIDWNNTLSDLADGLRITSGMYPTQLYNLAGPDATGRLVRDMVDDTFSDLYDLQAVDPSENDNDISFELTLERALVTHTITVNRAQFTDQDQPLSGTNEGRIAETYSFQALGSDDGLTGPVTIT